MKQIFSHRTFYCLQLCLGLCFVASGQGENNNWTFGRTSGVNFDSGSPVYFASAISTREGCAAISDPFGNLLFYSRGNMVWDRTHKPMPHGNLLGNAFDGSGTQAVLILKSLTNKNEYYHFTLDSKESASSFSPKLRYSIIDMSLNNGLGDVRTGMKDIVIDTAMEERMYAVEAHDCGYWIVSRKIETNIYVSYKLNENGIGPPVYSTATAFSTVPFGDHGELKISPDGKKIATVFGRSGILEIGNFDNVTGAVTNTKVLSSTLDESYGVCFSPDNSKLYATIEGNANLYQYDMTLFPDVQAMNDTRILIAATPPIRLVGLRLGPDGKMYMINHSDGYMSVVKYPNNAGLSCGYEAKAVAIPDTARSYGPGSGHYGENFGIPTVVLPKDTVPGSLAVITVCFEDSVEVAVTDDLWYYQWQDGVLGSNRIIHNSGMYYCTSTNACTIRIDSFVVQFVDRAVDLGPDQLLCPGDSFSVSLDFPEAGYLWQDGSTDSFQIISNSGTYTVEVNQNGCVHSDTIHVEKLEFATAGKDTTICLGTPLILELPADTLSTFLWSTGHTGPVAEVSQGGQYWVRIDNFCGSTYDTVEVVAQDCDCAPLIPTAFTPNGDGINDEFRILFNCRARGFNLSIYNRYGQRVYFGQDFRRGWDGNFGGQPADMGTYFFTLIFEKPNGKQGARKGDLTLLR